VCHCRRARDAKRVGRGSNLLLDAATPHVATLHLDGVAESRGWESERPWWAAITCRSEGGCKNALVFLESICTANLLPRRGVPLPSGLAARRGGGEASSGLEIHLAE
jgi:hypothetical protein